MREKATAIVLIVGVIALGAAALEIVRRQVFLPIASEDEPCPDVHLQRPCYAKLAKDIAAKEGFDVAFAYIDEKTRENSEHSVLHIAMHEIGKAAYRTTENLAESMGFFEEHTSPVNFDLGLEGFLHGVLQAFFEARQYEVDSLTELAEDACKAYLHFSEIDSSPEFEKRAAQNCFHGVGHAIMYVEGNDVFTSLDACDELARSWMRDWCGYGVFMENMYVSVGYYPYYETGASRPQQVTDSMVPLCEQLEGRWYEMCARYVGRTTFVVRGARNASDFEQIFNECKLLKAPYEEVCIRDAAMVVVPTAFLDDFEEIINACRTVGAKYETACLGHAALGISVGVAGFENRERPFCELLSEEQRESCTKTLTEKVYFRGLD